MNRHRIAFVTAAFFLSAWTGRADAAVAPPGPPVNLRATHQSTSAVVLEWADTATNEARFRIESRTGSAPFAFLRNVPKNKQSVVIGGLPQGTFFEFRVRAENAGGSSLWSESAGIFTDLQAAPAACVVTPLAVCLGIEPGRFRVEVRFRGHPGTTLESFAGTEFNSDTGYFFFAGGVPSLDVVVRVLNACGLNSRFWVFATSMTTTETVIAVTDTQTGRTRSYFQPLGKPFPAIQDVSAFATCP